MAHLTCPHCDTYIEVTWKRYWASANRIYNCPECNEESKIRTKPKFYQHISWLFQFLPIVIAVILSEEFGALGFLALVAWAPIFVLDKKVDEKFGELYKFT
jgi:hypothetical protein